MKYKTFRNLVLSGVVIIAGGGAYWLITRPVVPPAPVQALGESPREGAGPLRGGLGDEATNPEEPPAVRFLLSTLGKPASGEKLKDALGRSGPKINVYGEGGVWARAKVDLDRDEKWDEKWSVEPSGIKRRVSTADDDQTYDQESFWHQGAWTGAAGAAAAPLAANDTNASDRAVLLLIEQRVKPSLKDAARGQPFKVNLYSDGGTRWTRAKVDLDRDDRWDEKWTFKDDGRIEKQVAPDDDERYTQTLLRQGDAWFEK